MLETTQNCACCLTDNGPFVDLNNCSHTNFLESFLKNYDSSWLACITCHKQLENITNFKKRVVTSYAILNKQARLLNHHQKGFRQLTQCNLELISVTNKESPYCNNDLKLEIDTIEKSTTHVEELVKTCLLKEARVKLQLMPYKSDASLKIRKHGNSPEAGPAISKINNTHENLFDSKQKTATVPTGTKKSNENYSVPPIQRNIDKFFICHHCEQHYKTKVLLINHMKTHYPKKKPKFCLKCKDCKYEANSRRSLNKHKKVHNNSKSQVTISKKRRWESKPKEILLKQSATRSTKSKKTFACTFCKYKCDRRANLAKHIRTHTGEKPYVCMLCGNKYRDLSHLATHKRTHTGIKPYPRPKQYTLKPKLSPHPKPSPHPKLSPHPKPNPKKFSCTMCSLKCSSSQTLIIHMRKHTGEKPYSCTICDYRCSVSDSLVRHVRTHTGETPYSCIICDYKCNQSYQLKTHIRKHTGDKPYTCTICNCKFRYRSYFTRHMTIHSDEKPYSCSLCDYKCKIKNYLANHMKKHNGIKGKQYLCILCEYKSYSSICLVNHVTKEHGKK